MSAASQKIRLFLPETTLLSEFRAIIKPRRAQADTRQDEPGDGISLELSDPTKQNRLRLLVERLRSPKSAEDFCYAAPELLRGEPSSERSSVFSLAILVFEHLTGHHPFGEGDIEGRLDRIERGEMGGAVRFFSKVSAPIRSSLLRALSPYPESRPASLIHFYRSFVVPPALPAAPVSSLKIPIKTANKPKTATPVHPAPVRDISGPIKSEPSIFPDVDRILRRRREKRLAAAMIASACVALAFVAAHLLKKPMEPAAQAVATPVVRTGPVTVRPTVFTLQRIEEETLAVAQVCVQGAAKPARFGMSLYFPKGSQTPPKAFFAAVDGISPSERNCIKNSLFRLDAGGPSSHTQMVEFRVQIAEDPSLDRVERIHTRATTFSRGPQSPEVQDPAAAHPQLQRRDVDETASLLPTRL